MLVAMLGDDRVEAARGLAHSPDYRCPRCRSPVVLHARIGGWVVPHFKHKPDSSCTYGKGETPEHRAVKALLRDHYRAKGYQVEVERDLDA
jgi:competence protein CoiA